jgi:hypothetical protein
MDTFSRTPLAATDGVRQWMPGYYCDRVNINEFCLTFVSTNVGGTSTTWQAGSASPSGLLICASDMAQLENRSIHPQRHSGTWVSPCFFLAFLVGDTVATRLPASTIHQKLRLVSDESGRPWKHGVVGYTDEASL